MRVKYVPKAESKKSFRKIILRREGQARKGVWRMPRHQEATKDVVSCEKHRGAASE